MSHILSINIVVRGPKRLEGQPFGIISSVKGQNRRVGNALTRHTFLYEALPIPSGLIGLWVFNQTFTSTLTTSIAQRNRLMRMYYGDECFSSIM